MTEISRVFFVEITKILVKTKNENKHLQEKNKKNKKKTRFFLFHQNLEFFTGSLFLRMRNIFACEHRVKQGNSEKHFCKKIIFYIFKCRRKPYYKIEFFERGFFKQK